MRVNCIHLIELETLRRPANALNIEVGAFPAPRCKLKPPADWPEGMVSRWLLSGGDAMVLGRCSKPCPLDKERGEKS